MVLNELGQRINQALWAINRAPVISEQVLDDLVKEICAALLESDVNVRLVQNMRKNVKQAVDLEQLAAKSDKKRLIQKVVLEELIRLVDPGIEPFKPKKGHTNIFMFVGLQGSGKTTTCTKLAVHYQKRGWKVALVCADTFRAGAFDQLKQNATKAAIPFYGSYTEADPVAIASAGVEKFKQEKFEIIIVDTSGRHKQETELFMEMEQISHAVRPDSVVFVMDGTIGQAAEPQAKAFKSSVDVGAIIITKMDGHAKGGGAISAVAATKSPIIFIGIGEHLHDLERFSPRPFVSKMLGMGDLSGLLETVQDLKLDQDTTLLKKLEKGEFSLRDMYTQFQTIQKLGPLSQVMSMIPGIPPEMMAGTEKEGTKRIKKMQVIMDSMTDQELDSDAKIFETEPTRVKRVARGAGVPFWEVLGLIAQYKQFANVVKKMGGPKGLMKTMMEGKKQPSMGRGQMPSKSQMQQMQKKMSSFLPPGMLDQVGGMAGLQQMAQQMMQGGDLSSLLGGMGPGMVPGMPNPGQGSSTGKRRQKK